MIDWVWYGPDFQAPRPPLDEVVECYRRARGAIELARVAIEPAQPFESGPLDALSCDLLAQSVYWSLLGHRVSAGVSRAAANEAAVQKPVGSSLRPELESLWNQTDRDLVSKAAGDAAGLEKLRLAIVGKSFVDFADLASGEQARLARDLLAFAERLSEPLDGARRQLEKLWRRRLLRLAPFAVVLVALAVTAVVAFQRADRLRNVAQGKAWTPSSLYAAGGCVSPDQECEGGIKYFFHTNQENSPWIEIDLGAVHSISGLDVRNRTDCCGERAIPLVVEVSLDHAAFREVARRTEEFINWKPAFQPVQARWVRLRVDRFSILHLARVRVLR